MTLIPHCTAHGRMLRRENLFWWECWGFDGEGCPARIVYDDDLKYPGNNSMPGITVTKE